jgi:DNA-directed RNA polymerase subunit H
MDSELLDLVSRTRPTILEILANRGYDTSPLQDQSPETLVRTAATNPTQLNFKVHHEEQTAHVLYWIESATRLRLEGLVNKLWDEEAEEVLDPKKDEVIVILSEPFNDVFHVQAVKMWSQRQARISFFHIKQLVVNPAKHFMVPPHTKLTAEESQNTLAKYHIRHKNELPRIIYHVDMQARVLGLVPGDIVEIQRHSPTSGTYTHYRVCTLS